MAVMPFNAGWGSRMQVLRCPAMARATGNGLQAVRPAGRPQLPKPYVARCLGDDALCSSCAFQVAAQRLNEKRDEAHRTNAARRLPVRKK